MSAIRQVRVRESDTLPAADPEMRIAAPAPVRDNPLQLLREAIASLNSSNGELPDQAQVADLLAEARQALEHAHLIARVLAECEESLKEAQFDKAFQALDAGLLVYPTDPALVARRREVEEQQSAFHSAALARTALEEAQWLFDQDRPDLAAQLLREKAGELPDQPALTSRLKEIEALLPQWEQNRLVQAALGRAAALEQPQQWRAALTILEEALRSYPESEELSAAAERVRDRLADHERQGKLARRLELIRQKIAAQSWRQALTLLESTQKEFPDAPELNLLRREADDGLARSECEAIVTEVRQCLADGEPEQAEQALRRGLESLGQEPALEALREELESDRKYREDLRNAQILFGRRQLREAEHVLTRLAVQNRPEAQALLDAVRQARAATEEERFCERGREKALKLMQQQQFGQAADLLRNLLSLFPGNAILERDLLAAQAAVDQRAAEVSAPVTGEEPETPAPPMVAPQPKVGVRQARGGSVRVGFHSRAWLAAVAGTASLVLVSAGGVAWKLSRHSAAVSRPAARPAVAQVPAATPPPVTQDAQKAQGSSPQPAAEPPLSAAIAAPVKVRTQPEPASARALRPFVPPATQQAPAQGQNPVLPAPPGTVAIVSAETVSGLPGDLGKPANAPAPPPAAPPQAATAPTPAVATSTFQAAQVVDRPLPDYPAMARQRALFGIVKMEATVDEHGAVKNVKVVSGDPVLAASARNAVTKWRYKPATLNGKPIATSVSINMSFGDPNK